MLQWLKEGFYSISSNALYMTTKHISHIQVLIISYLLFVRPPAHKTEMGTANTWETTNSKLSLQHLQWCSLCDPQIKSIPHIQVLIISYLLFVQPRYP
jgi:hypothetical protein